MSRAHARAEGRRPQVPMAVMTFTVALLAVLLPSAISASRAASDRTPDSRTGTLVVGPHQASDQVRFRPRGVTEDRPRGMVYRGLVRSELCPGAFRLIGVLDDTGCTTGPEPLHEGGSPGKDRQHVDDVSKGRSTAELYAAADTSPADAQAAATTTVPCYGDGVSGSRVQAVYAVASDQVDRYDSVAPLIQSSYAPRVDAVFFNSAAVGGEVRHVRWVTTPDCKVDVIHAVLSPTGDDSLTNTRTELKNLGLNRVDRKYLVWVDANVYCGIGNVTSDTQPGAANAANAGPTFGRVDTGCWGFTSAVEAHELAHTLGAVQLGAPHSNGSWHCTDEYDRMCYVDGSGTPVDYVCPSTGEALFDCGGDDYFNVNPTPGSWLDAHWNVADSVFLASSEPESGPSPTATSSASPTPTVTETPTATSTTTTSSATTTPLASPTSTSTPTPSASPSPTKTKSAGGRGKKTVSGTLTKADPRETFLVRTAEGRVAAEVAFGRADNLHLKVMRLDGRLVADRFGPSVLHLARDVRANTYRIVVRGGPTSFRLTVSYPL